MNKKIIASLLIVASAFVSSIASAAITYTNSKDAVSDGQNANAVAVAGGGAVRANDLIVVSGLAADIAADDEIIVRLPAGINFDGEPSYLSARSGGATATIGLTLKDTSEFGDPTLDDPKIELADTDGDGGMDRALVTVSSDATAGDTLTISLNVTASADVKAQTGLKASVIVGGNLAVVQEIVDVVAALSTPVSASSTGQAEDDQNPDTDLNTSGAPFIVTIPAGTAGGKTITLTPGANLRYAASGASTVTYTIHTPGFAASAITPVSGTVAGTATVAVSFSTNWATTATNEDPIQIQFTVAAMDAVAIAPATTVPVGLKVLTIGGTAGVSGNAALVEVKPNGSEATLITGAKATDIVAGSSAPQTLPTIQVEENFDTDLGGSFTITAGTGLSFSGTGTISVTGITGTITVNAANTVLTVTPFSPNGASDTITISGITAIASSTASGALTVEVDSTSAAAPFGPKDDVLTVANAVPVGDVTVSILSTQVNDVGADNYVGTSTITVKESTYGAITTSNATQVNDAYFRITPSSNADILAVGVTTANYDAGTSPTIAVTEACEAENNVTTGAWICKVEGESTAVNAPTSSVSVTVTYETDKASVGDTVDMAFDGNSSVEGTVTVADVKISTTASVTGAIPDLTPGDDEAGNMATVQIKENFTGAVTANGSFRLVAPSGVAFQDAASVQAQAAIGTATITATFNPNDTLVLTAALTQTITFTAKAVIADGLSGKVAVDIFDGDIEGNGGAGVTEEEVIIVYAGELDTLSGGSDGSVNVGFVVDNAITGGLAPYTVKSSNTALATTSVDDSTVTTEGVSAGGVTITVTDDLGATDTFDITVNVGATQPEAEKDGKTLSGDPLPAGAAFTAGASTDGGDTFGTEFTTTDDVTIVATVSVDTASQGTAGGIHVALKSDTDAGTDFSFLNEDGNFETWDISGLPGIHIDADALASTYNVTIFTGNLAAGTYRIALAYSVEGGDVIYTGKAITITVTE